MSNWLPEPQKRGLGFPRTGCSVHRAHARAKFVCSLIKWGHGQAVGWALPGSPRSSSPSWVCPVSPACPGMQDGENTPGSSLHMPRVQLLPGLWARCEQLSPGRVMGWGSMPFWDYLKTEVRQNKENKKQFYLLKVHFRQMKPSHGLHPKNGWQVTGFHTFIILVHFHIGG